jgi:hypothetical protein
VKHLTGTDSRFIRVDRKGELIQTPDSAPISFPFPF